MKKDQQLPERMDLPNNPNITREKMDRLYQKASDYERERHDFFRKHRIDLRHNNFKHYLCFLKTLLKKDILDNIYFSSVIITNWINLSSDIYRDYPEIISWIGTLHSGLLPKLKKIFEAR